MAPKQRKPGQAGNTSHGHRSNRVHSHRRGGNSHAKREDKKVSCFWPLATAATAAGAVLGGLGYVAFNI